MTQPVNTDAAARIAQVDQVLADNGVAFKEPIWFAAGTELIQVGKDSVELSRKNFNKKDDVAVAMDKGRALYEAQGRKDIEVDLGTLKMFSDGPNAGRITRGNGTFGLSQLCLGQLVARANPNVKWGGAYLVSVDTALRAHNVNAHLDTFRSMNNAAITAATDKIRSASPSGADITAMAKAAKDAPEPVVFRTMIDAATSKRAVYAIVSKKYAAYDLPQGAQDFLNLLEQKKLLDNAKGEVMVSGAKWSITVYFHNPIPADGYAVGDILHFFVRLKGVDDGSGGMVIESGWTRTRCVNNTTIFTRKIEGSIRHSGKSIAQRLLPTLNKALALAGKVADLWADAAQSYVLDQAIADGAGMRYVFGQLIEMGRIKLSGYSKEVLVERCMQGWAKEGGQCTKAAISNALTWAAHTQRWNSYEDIEELEAQAGQLLYAKVVIPTPEAVAADRAEASRWGLLEVN